MKKNLNLGTWCTLAFLGCWTWATPLWAQTNDRPLQKVFDFFQPKKTAPTPTLREDANRLAEIFVELAWLGNPLTFPFYLEARVDNGLLEVRGNVPSRGVREQALKLARLHSPLPVVDALKENPGMMVRPVRLSASQLQNGVQSTLREAMPRQVKNLQARSSADGKVVLSGTVSSFEEKLAISQALRRLNGCVAVTNVVQVASDPDGSLARNFSSPSPGGAAAQLKTASRPNTPNQGQEIPLPFNTGTIPTSNFKNQGPLSAQTTSLGKEPMIGLGQPLSLGNAPATTEQPPAAISSRGVVVVPEGKKNGPPLTQAQLKKRIEQACPGAREIKINFTSATDVRVEVRASRQEEGDQLAGAILSLQELEAYRVDLHITLPQP
jgi:hypothetical protein